MKKINKNQKLVILIAIATMIIIIGAVICANIIKTNIANGKYNSSNGASNNGNLLPEYIKKGITLGGVTGTLEDLDTSDATARPEDIVEGKTAYVKGKKITGTYEIFTLKDLEIGDYVEYKPDIESTYNLNSTYSGYTSNQTIKQENLNWRVLSINTDGTINLISATPTSQKISLGNAKGYNNGVYILNDIAANLYSNDSLGVTARSVTIEDIETGMTAEGLNYVHSFTSAIGAKYGETKTYKSNRYYPNIYAEENGSGIDLESIEDPNSKVKEDGIIQSDSYYNSFTTETYLQASRSLTVTETYYDRDMKSSYYKNDTFYNLIHSGYYWIASRFVYLESSRAYFGIRHINNNSFYSSSLFFSDRTNFNYDGGLRPVITLKSNIKIVSGNGKSPETAYQIIM